MTQWTYAWTTASLWNFSLLPSFLPPFLSSVLPSCVNQILFIITLWKIQKKIILGLIHFEFGNALLGDSEMARFVLHLPDDGLDAVYPGREPEEDVLNPVFGVLSSQCASLLLYQARNFWTDCHMLFSTPEKCLLKKRCLDHLIPRHPFPSPQKKTAEWTFRVCIVTECSMGWCGTAWRRPAVGLASESFQVKSALCRVTVSTPPSLLLRVPCISHCSSSLPLCGVNVAFSSVTFWLPPPLLLVLRLSCTAGETLSLRVNIL